MLGLMFVLPRIACSETRNCWPVKSEAATSGTTRVLNLVVSFRMIFTINALNDLSSRAPSGTLR
jgi:hypothetical protein